MSNRRLTRVRLVAATLAALVIAAQVPGALARRNTASKKKISTAAPHGLVADFAHPTPFFIVVKQPDGTAVRAKLSGAEIGGNLEVDGYAIVKSKSGWWYYADRADGSDLHASKRRAGLDSPKGLKQGLGRIPSIWSGKAGSLRAQTFRMLQMANYQAQQQAAITGELPRVFRVPFVMFATWYDKAAGQTEPQFQEGHDAEFFTKLLDGFGGNPTGTMTEFWLENSYGQLLVDVDVYGPYTSPRSMLDACYYGNVNPEYQGESPNPLNSGNLPIAVDDESAGADADGAEDDFLDPAGVGPIPRIDDLDPVGNFLGIGGLGGAGMAIEAVPLADADIDFSKYDNDEDGYADFVGFIHSGPDMAATGDPCQTWSHMIQVSTITSLAPALVAGAAGIPDPTPFILGMPTLDIGANGLPVMVDRVLTVPEVNLDIGVAVHEMMHALGEPDYYNTSYTSAGTGDWDIMAGGSWFGNPPGSNPIGANPATKAFQGWITPKVVHGDMRNVALPPRELLPMKGYNGTKVDPNILLIPITWTDSTAPADVYGLVKDPANGKFITEGWYIEHISRSVTGPPDFEQFKRSPYFDRLALSSGVMIWHFDYHKKSNVYYGENDGQSDPNRPQLDPEEFDYNDNTQEIQLNWTRGEPSDLWYGAATGMTSATRLVPAGLPSKGTPDDDITGEGVTPPGGVASYEFEVSNNPGNYRLQATAVGLGDCTLALYRKENGKWVKVGDIDSGFVAAEEELNVYNPPAGDWKIEIGDFAACLRHSWKIDFSLPYLTMGAADSWTNEREAANGDQLPGSPTGWAITNIGPNVYDGWEHSADAGGKPVITLDILKLDDKEIDVSPGFVSTPLGSTQGTLPLNVGEQTTLNVPVFNNGGKAVKNVAVTLKTLAGQTIGSKVVDRIEGYGRATVSFAWTPTVEGVGHVVAAVDPADTIGEAHEGNNVQRTKLLVGPANPSVLVVDDDGAFDAEDTYLGALSALGVPWSYALGHADLATMKRYSAVIWESGLDRYQGQLSAGDRDRIRQYLNGGGRFWYLSPRAAAALGEVASGTNPGGGTDEMIGLLRDYFGAKYVDTLQVGGGTIKGIGDAIGAKLSMASEPFPGRPLQDQLDVEKSAFAKVTKVLDWSKGPAIGTKVEGDAAHKNFRAVYFGFNLSQLLDGNDQIAITKSVLTWLGVKVGTYSPAGHVVYHTQVRTRAAHEALRLNAYIFGASGPVTVLYRPRGVEGWQKLTMKAGASNLYEATIPGAWATLRGLEYFIVAGTAMTEPAAAPNLAHYVGIAPPEVNPPQVAGTKFVRGGNFGGSTGSGSDLPATGVASGWVGLIPIVAAAASALWLRRRRTT